MAEERPRIRPSLRDSLANWRQSELPFLGKLGVALRNYSRRFGFPPKNCCDHLGEPGC